MKKIKLTEYQSAQLGAIVSSMDSIRALAKASYDLKISIGLALHALKTSLPGEFISALRQSGLTSNNAIHRYMNYAAEFKLKGEAQNVHFRPELKLAIKNRQARRRRFIASLSQSAASALGPKCGNRTFDLP